ncbi:LacI family DNA-binding transcriptional regulator [Pontiellaceae bacterium B12219]|nr:LacI family DNA-binding transcriptional regulator [Pontiellaceae bacterium B12219]
MKNERFNRISQRDIASELRISHVTVSRALRNMANVSPELKARILAKADEMGYVPDPLLASLSRYSKTGGNNPVQAELAWLNTWTPPEKLRQFQEFELYWQGASDNARRMGYRVVEFNLSEIPLLRLKTILRTRNIQGILLPPVGNIPAVLENFDWSDYAVVRFGRATPEPRAHFVSSSQHENTMMAFDRIQQLGYQRIGCACEYERRRLFGSGFFWAQQKLPLSQQLPILTWHPENISEQQIKLKQWLEQNRPDAILTDNSETHRMLDNLGYRIPEDIALATTTVHDTDIDTGIDQRPYEIGWAATRMLTALMNEKSFGLPRNRSELLIEGSWVDGSMMPKKSIFKHWK